MGIPDILLGRLGMDRVVVFAWNYTGCKVEATILPCENKNVAHVVADSLAHKYSNYMIAQGDEQIKVGWYAIGAEVTDEHH